jgi:virginiamycin B lyase
MSNHKRTICAAFLGLAGLGLALWLAIAPNGTVAAATQGSITGVVTDDAGKPIRGAAVTAKIDNMSVSRYSDASGKYSLDGLKPGNYSISATSYGYETKSVNKEIGGAPSDVAFSLKQHWDPSIISTAEYISAFGNDKDVHKIEGTCTVCHNFSWIMRKRGQTASEWEDFIPNMSPRHLFVTPRLSPDQLQDISVSLEKVFGPDAPLPTKEQVHHVEISDEALNATFKIYTPPTHIIAHSIVVAPNGLAWFTEQDNFSNKIASFDPRTSEFQEFEMPTPKSGPHNPWVARNGMIWISENAAHKLAMLDPQTGKITEYTPPEGAGTHTLREDLDGNIWASGARMTKFDVQTKKFTVYDTPGTYDIAVDHENNIWGAACLDALTKGMLARIDAKTGDLKIYPVPNATFLRGIEVDAQDNVWFGDVMGHRLGKLDQKTEKMTFFTPPTTNFSIYGIVIDKKTGKIWAADYLGANVSRLDPATGKWTEFPFPTRTQMIRFFGEDAQSRIWFTDFTNGRIGVLDTGESKAPMSAQR